ncbi:unnamed protein product [Brassicogethes aeneus]|uniref:Myrosinase 1-like n=1 Tax=Brassicogethes aeneus TaxID=1431903 RepID=A0A9P0FIX0_BRAAE|nr:unnamed protein product [Brassicogethes aeneus]
MTGQHIFIITAASIIFNVYAIKVPADFKFGVATAAYQVEGGWNASGKGENIWDRLTHTHPELIADHSTGDIACDSYHKWKEDIDILKTVGVEFYRFSISWSRIMPTGFTNKINPDGIKYYNDIIDELLKNNIEPMVTIFHWDLPQPIQDLGGWTNPQISVYFEDYARVVFENFGDRVKKWITINEPSSICEDTYGKGNNAPNILSPGIGDYLCGKTILLCHARTYHLYKNEFGRQQRGKIGITIDSIWAEPKTNQSADISASVREMQMGTGWWMHPILSKEGDYPAIMKSRINEISKAENFSESRLVPLYKHEIKYIRGTADFLGLNHYHTWLVSDNKYPITDPTSFNKDKGTKLERDPKWKNPLITPWGIRKLINWVKDEYDNPLIYITENGYQDDGCLDDKDRVLFYKGYISEVIQAATTDKCNVKGYTAWSIMDNMEWRSGYTIKFGLYHVDFSSPNRTRTPKSSAKFYQYVIKNRNIPNDK